MNKKAAEQIINAYSEAFEKMGFGNFHQGMSQLCELAQKELNLWKQARTRQGLMAALLKEPEPTAQSLSATLAMAKLLPYKMRKGFQEAAKKIQPDPGGRPQVITPQEGREICAEIGALIGQGVKLPDALERVAERRRKPQSKKAPLRTIKRVWYERNDPKSRFYLDNPIEKAKETPHEETARKTAMMVVEP